MTRTKKAFRAGEYGSVRTVAASLVLACLIGTGAQADNRSNKNGGAAAVASDPRAGLRLARALRNAGDAGAAAQILRGLADAKDADPALRIELGDTLLDANLMDEAIGVYSAVPVNSNIGAEAQLGLAHAYLNMNQPAKALDFAQRAATLAPNNERVLIGQGVALDMSSRHLEAQASYRAALAIKPRSAAARNDLALSLALTGQFDDAIEILAPIARSANASPRDRQNLAFVYGMKGDRAAAFTLSRADLDDATARTNSWFFDFVRQQPR